MNKRSKRDGYGGYGSWNILISYLAVWYPFTSDFAVKTTGGFQGSTARLGCAQIHLYCEASSRPGSWLQGSCHDMPTFLMEFDTDLVSTGH